MFFRSWRAPLRSRSPRSPPTTTSSSTEVARSSSRLLPLSSCRRLHSPRRTILGCSGCLNSSTAAFWFKQVCHNEGWIRHRTRGSATGEVAATSTTTTARRSAGFPSRTRSRSTSRSQLDTLAQERQQRLPAALAASLPMPRADWEQNRDQADRLLREMIALQEELDWRCYRLYGVTHDELTYQDGTGQPLTPRTSASASGPSRSSWPARWPPATSPPPGSSATGPRPSPRSPSAGPRRTARSSSAGSSGSERPLRRPAGAARVQAPLERGRLGRPGRRPPSAAGSRRGSKTPATGAATPPPDRPPARRGAERDDDFMDVAELYRGEAGFDVGALVTELVEPEAVPLLPAERYKPRASASGPSLGGDVGQAAPGGRDRPPGSRVADAAEAERDRRDVRRAVDCGAAG